MENYVGIEYLKRKLETKKDRVSERYKYYEMKNVVRDFNIVTPEKFKHFKSCLGWCAKGVDALADRIVFREFGNDSLNLNGIYEYNNGDILFGDAVLSALISSCSFIYISPDEAGNPRMQVIDGGNATGVIDPITRMLKEGYAVLERNKDGHPTLEAYFTPEYTEFFAAGKLPTMAINNTGYTMLVPIVYRPDAKRPFGHSRISRACMDYTQSALRTIKRSEISAEFYSFPQKYVLGLDEDAEQMDTWKATISSFLRFDKDENGDRPTVGQFSQQSMSPYTEQIRTFAALFAGETGLTLDDLGFVSDNPSSSEAIKASHENLRLTARKAQKCFGVGFKNAGLVAACLRDDFHYDRQVIIPEKAIFEPIFEPDMATLSAIGDGALKINQAIPGYFDEARISELTGM
jgi:hypothetical protein